MIEAFFLAFIPLFVAVDPIGLLPIFLSLTEDLTHQQKRKIIFQSMLTATALAIGFILVGKITFKFLGITVGDFMIAGGAILFGIAMMDLIQPDKRGRRVSGDDLGVVPIWTPLVVGPAVLTTSIILADQHGMGLTMFAVFLNVLIVGIVFSLSDSIIKMIGAAGARAMSKLMALLLAAIAVMMIRRGIMIVVGST